MNIIMISILERSIQIDLLLDRPNKINVWFDSILDTLYSLEANVYHENGGEFIYYRINSLNAKEWVFYHNTKNDKFLCNCANYWIIFKQEFNVRYFKIQTFTKILVDNALNTNIALPTHSLISEDIRVGNVLIYNSPRIIKSNQIKSKK